MYCPRALSPFLMMGQGGMPASEFGSTHFLEESHGC